MTTRSCHNNKMVDIGSRTGDQIIDSFSESTSWHHLCHLFPPHHYHYLASSAYCNNITFIFTLTLSHLPQIRDYQYSEVIRSYPNTPINQTSSDTPLQLLHLPVSFTTYLPTYLPRYRVNNVNNGINNNNNNTSKLSTKVVFVNLSRDDQSSRFRANEVEIQDKTRGRAQGDVSDTQLLCKRKRQVPV